MGKYIPHLMTNTDFESLVAWLYTEGAISMLVDTPLREQVAQIQIDKLRDYIAEVQQTGKVPFLPPIEWNVEDSV